MVQDLISEKRFLSIIIPTYNEAENILKLLDAIRYHLPTDVSAEIIIVKIFIENAELKLFVGRGGIV